MRKRNNNHKRFDRSVAGVFKDISYVIHSNGNQGFFNLKSGDYENISLSTFNMFLGTRQRWIYTNYALLLINEERIVKADCACRRELSLTLKEHFSFIPSELSGWTDQQNNNHLVGTLSMASMSNSIEPTNEVVSKIIKFLETHKPKKASK